MTSLCLKVAASLWMRSYLKAYTRLSSDKAVAEKVCAYVRQHAPPIVEREVRASSPSQRFNFTLCAAVLTTDTAVRQFDARATPACTNRAITDALSAMPFTHAYGRGLAWLARASARTPEGQQRFFTNPAVINTITNFKVVFFGLLDTSAESSAIVMSACGFTSFFRRHNVPHLAPIICTLDNAWMQAFLKDGKVGIWCKRSATISTGATKCRFEILTKNGTERFDDVVVRRMREQENSRQDP
mmetsp:Transcript_6477/g.16356  ORF Transcript_6477/g.16356 Transcript_6477/m.16356 type:complete len:243 (-) Transcript_6477:587-1315(-)